LSLALVCGTATLLAPSALRAGDGKDRKTLRLETAHFKNALIDGAKTVSLWAVLDGKGGGKGTLVLDPNLWGEDGWTSTTMATWEVKVTLQEVKDDEHARKGRRSYQVKGDKVGRLLLVVPAKGGGSCWLVIVGKDGVQDVIEMWQK
jgi:hypothetical protein